MNELNAHIDSMFHPLNVEDRVGILSLAMVVQGQPHPWCRLAVSDLQNVIREQDWQHNFGLAEMEGRVIGKMFGVLVVRADDNTVGYLAAFSGKLAGSNHHPGFVPPVYDSLVEDGFLNAGMRELADIATEIRTLEDIQQAGDNLDTVNRNAIAQSLREKRKAHSTQLQTKLFQHYQFLNIHGVIKTLTQVFADAGYRNPPSGAGECAGPKLLQYAFQHGFEPIALAEFWWGQSPKSVTWKHGEFYPCCKEKCEPILKHLLEGIVKS